MIKHQRGQALLELLGVLPMITLFILFVFSFSYSIYSKEISSYHLYRALICTEEFEAKDSDCISDAEDKIKNSLFFHKEFYFKKNLQSSKKTLSLSAQFLSYETHYSKSIKVIGP